MSQTYNPEVYDDEYYQSHCGPPYDREYDNGYWLRFFDRIAHEIVSRYQPAHTLDVGCAKGFLVEQLRQRGVDATGFDVSLAALEQVDSQVANFCYEGSADDSGMYRMHYDVITCIEVVEHLTAEMAARAIGLMCSHADIVLFSSSPSDFEEPTHINVQPVEHWIEQFAAHGFKVYEGNGWEKLALVSHALVLMNDRTHTQYQLKELQEAYDHLLTNNQALQTQVEQQSAVALKLQRDVERTNDMQRAIENKDVHIQNIEAQLRLTNQHLVKVLNTKGWRALNVLRLLRHALEHPRSSWRKLYYAYQHLGARGILDRFQDKLLRQHSNDTEITYDQWYRLQQAAFSQRIAEVRREIGGWEIQPLVSILMPTYNSRVEWLEDAIASLLAQPYDNWELLISDDASTRDETRQYLAALHSRDVRIHVLFNERNTGISGATNVALSVAQGELITFMDHDDVLSRDALYEIVKEFMNDRFDILYSDEDKLSEAGEYCDVFFKPDYSPEYLFSCNYINHLTVYRREVVSKVGLFRSEYDGAQDHDFLLRATEVCDRIVHLPKVLYHWRKVPGSTAESFDFKSYANDAGKAAVMDALRRKSEPGEVIDTGFPGHYRVRRFLQDSPLVSIIIPMRDKVELLMTCLESIRSRSTYQNYELIIVDNGSQQPETLAFLRDQSDCTVLRYDIPFNYSRLNNLAVTEAKGQYLLFLNNDIEVITSEWLEEMLQHAVRPDIGVVGAKLLYPNDKIQHAGIVLGIGGVAGHSHKFFPRYAGGYFSTLADIRNYSAVTGACMMVRKTIFQDVGGFDEENLSVAFNDVDLCLRIRDAGYRCVYTPYAELYHYESVTRGPDLNPKEVHHMQMRWGDALESDPYYNVNLTLDSEDYRHRLVMA